MNVSYDSIIGIGQNQLELVESAQNISTGGKLLALALLTITLFLYYLVFSTVPNTSNNSTIINNSNGAKLLEIIMWGTFIVLIIVNGYQYFFNLNITTNFKNLFNDEPEIEINVENPEQSEVTVPQLKYFKQVFHIPGNEYTYEDSKEVCKAFDARLATYDEIEKSYANGGEWCSYGWSDGQMALFPTQKKTWKKLQKIKGHKNDCGRPGINGGYIMNPNVKFGINCYGFKPKITSSESNLMQSSSIYPKTLKDIKKEERVAYWRTKLNDIIIAPFNSNVWSA